MELCPIKRSSYAPRTEAVAGPRTDPQTSLTSPSDSSQRCMSSRTAHVLTSTSSAVPNAQPLPPMAGAGTVTSGCLLQGGQVCPELPLTLTAILRSHRGTKSKCGNCAMVTTSTITTTARLFHQDRFRMVRTCSRSHGVSGMHATSTTLTHLKSLTLPLPAMCSCLVSVGRILPSSPSDLTTGWQVSAQSPRLLISCSRLPTCSSF